MKKNQSVSIDIFEWKLCRAEAWWGKNVMGQGLFYRVGKQTPLRKYGARYRSNQITAAQIVMRKLLSNVLDNGLYFHDSSLQRMLGPGRS